MDVCFKMRCKRKAKWRAEGEGFTVQVSDSESFDGTRHRNTCGNHLADGCAEIISAEYLRNDRVDVRVVSLHAERAWKTANEQTEADATDTA